ncbi:pre-mRNA-processing factor 39-like isoform X1 [Diadema setosum]|uniref:pre-mRNA-processing factor 39-like isoform X1 n=1 Tax=Diadema setosum TaxID=31175 RepID=UPI003B3B0ED6
MARGKRASRGKGRGKPVQPDADDAVDQENMADDSEPTEEILVEVEEGAQQEDQDDKEEFDGDAGESPTSEEKMEEEGAPEAQDAGEKDAEKGQESAADDKGSAKEEETPMETHASDGKEQNDAPAAEVEKVEDAATDSKADETPKEDSSEKKEKKDDSSGPPKKETEKKERKKKKERARPYELEKYWKAVNMNPADFTGWTYLLQFVEQEDYMPFYREAFDAFFEHYPYCYGYWKKYADAERKKGHMDNCWAVFKRGLAAIPLSLDLWLHYISISSQNIPKSDEQRAEKLRELYEQAVAAAGMDFRSDKLWDQYINFEKKDQKDWKKVMQLYDRLLKIPTQLYRHHFDKMKEFIQSHIPKEYLDFDEFLSLREQVVAEANPQDADDDEGGAPGDDAPPGEEGPPGEDAPPGVSTSSSKVIEGENKLIQEKVIESRRAVFRKTEQEVSKRWAYEEAIRRPYFHAKPLEKGQLKTWREYLEFEESTGQHERTVLLYERCLIACALYEEFWLKYARYMEKQSIESASKVFKRACNTHLPSKPAINIQWAAFEEKNGNMDKAKEILERLQEKQPDSVMIRLERINFERRQGDKEKVITLYKGCIDDAKTATGQSFFASKLARFYLKIMGDNDMAIEALKEVLEQKQVSPILREQIYTQMLDIEYQRQPVSEEKMTEIFDAVLTSNVGQDVKIQFAQRKVQFLQDFGMNPVKTHDAVEEHQKLVKSLTSGKKRSAEASGDASSSSNQSSSGDSKKKRRASSPSGQGQGQGQGSSSQGYNATSSSYNYNYGYGTPQGNPTTQGQGQGGVANIPYPQSWGSWGQYFQQ